MFSPQQKRDLLEHAAAHHRDALHTGRDGDQRILS
jgi:hypothetical protein